MTKYVGRTIVTYFLTVPGLLTLAATARLMFALHEPATFVVGVPYTFAGVALLVLPIAPREWWRSLFLLFTLALVIGTAALFFYGGVPRSMFGP